MAYPLIHISNSVFYCHDLSYINSGDRLLTLIPMLNGYISAKWRLPSPPCLQGNGLENDRLCAIILLGNQRSIRESVKRVLNDVKQFIKGEWKWTSCGQLENCRFICVLNQSECLLYKTFLSGQVLENICVYCLKKSQNITTLKKTTKKNSQQQ